MNDNITNNVPGNTEEPVHPWWDARTSLVSPRMRNLNHDSLNARLLGQPTQRAQAARFPDGAGWLRAVVGQHRGEGVAGILHPDAQAVAVGMAVTA